LGDIAGKVCILENALRPLSNLNGVHN
jgi:hypothetical protein